MLTYDIILQTARIYSFVLIYEFGGRSAVGFYVENVIGVQYKLGTGNVLVEMDECMFCMISFF